MEKLTKLNEVLLREGALQLSGPVEGVVDSRRNANVAQVSVTDGRLCGGRPKASHRKARVRVTSACTVMTLGIPVMA